MDYITCNISGRLGNYFFIIISTWSYAKKNNMKFVMKENFKNDKYFSSFFNRIETYDSIDFQIKKDFDVFEECLNFEREIGKNIIFNGYLQNSNNFQIYRDEILNHFFNIDINHINKNNNFFIHIRLKDFLSSKTHYIDLDKYYEEAIQYVSEKINKDNTNFYIISDDINHAKQKSYLNLLPEKNKIFLNNEEYDEVKTFDIFKNCYLGCIVGNSTFSWWGAYVINNPEKIVVVPNKFLNTQDDFSGFYMDYKVINV